MADITRLTRQEELAVTAKVLQEVAQTGIIPENPVWSAYHKAVAQSYVEVLILKKSVQGRWAFLLTRREKDDPHFPGQPWHIPGGIWRTPWTLEEACQQVAARELGNAKIRFVCEVMTTNGSTILTDFPYHTSVYALRKMLSQKQTTYDFSSAYLPPSCVTTTTSFESPSRHWINKRRPY